MKTLFSFIFISFICASICLAQPVNNYKYYNKSRHFVALNKLDSALFYINKYEATKSFDYQGANLKLKIFYQLRSKKMLDEFYNLVEKVGYEIDDFYNYIKTKEDSLFFLNKIKAEIIEQNYFDRYRIYHCKLNTQYALEINKIYLEDQFIRKMGHYIDDDDSLTRKKQHFFIGVGDSLNLVAIKNCFSKYGLPLNAEIGRYSYNLVMVAMHICANKYLSSNYNYIDSVFKKAVIENQFNPELYMLFNDYVSQTKNDCQIYGTFQTRKEFYKFCDEDFNSINRKRRAVFGSDIMDELRFYRLSYPFKNSPVMK